jgi:hypothetical protein
MAQLKGGHEIPLDIKATICDYVSQGKDEDERSERRAEMANKYRSISRATINSMTAHIKFRLRDVKATIREHMGNERSTMKDANTGMEFADDQDALSAPVVKTMKKAEDSLESSEYAHALLRQNKLREAIAAFGKANDTEALRRIAEVYENERPDIAAEALLAGGMQREVMALIGKLTDGHRNAAKKILELVKKNA